MSKTSDLIAEALGNAAKFDTGTVGMPYTADLLTRLATALATAQGEVEERRCETCAHWRFEAPDWEYDDLRLGECKGIRQREDIDSDAVMGLEDRYSDEAVALKKAAVLAAKAIAVDGSGYYAAVRTAPDFGCVLWSAALARPPQGGDGT